MTAPAAPWDEPDSELLDRLTHNGTFAADTAVIALPSSCTGAEKTRVAVRAALRMLLANGLVTATAPGDWPEYVRIDAPDGK